MRKKIKLVMLVIFGLTLATAVFAQDNFLVNSNFEQTNKNNTLTAWKTYKGKQQQAGSGINSSKCLQSSAKIPAGKQFKSNSFQIINKLESGKYVLSGYYKGNLSALWIVVSFDKASKSAAAKFTKWLSRSKFKKSDIDGWNRFSFMVKAPEGTAKGLFTIEAFCNSKDTVVFFDDIKLVKQND